MEETGLEDPITLLNEWSANFNRQAKLGPTTCIALTLRSAALRCTTAQCDIVGTVRLACRTVTQRAPSEATESSIC